MDSAAVMKKITCQLVWGYMNSPLKLCSLKFSISSLFINYFFLEKHCLGNRGSIKWKKNHSLRLLACRSIERHCPIDWLLLFLVSIELQLQELGPVIRSEVYAHLEAFVPCNKGTLVKRLRKLHLNVQVRGEQ